MLRVGLRACERTFHTISMRKSLNNTRNYARRLDETLCWCLVDVLCYFVRDFVLNLTEFVVLL